jgi:hypothetical protein
MSARLQERLFALSGVLFVVLELGGAFYAMGTGTTHDLTVSSTTSEIAKAIAHPAGAGVWVGAYMELVSVIFFLVFAAWTTERLGGGPLGSVARLAAAAYAGVTLVALGIGNAISYQAGGQLSVATARTLVTVNEAVYVSTWFVGAGFLAAVGILALRAGRRVAGWSALGIVAYTLVITPLSVDNFGQFSQMFWLLWMVGASIALARAPRRAPSAALAAGI